MTLGPTLDALWQRQDAHDAKRLHRWGLTAAEETSGADGQEAEHDDDNNPEVTR